MRILHVINSLNPASGGPTTACASLAAGQALLGHDVAVFGYRHVPSEADIRVQLSGIRGINALEFLLQPVPSRFERLTGAQAGMAAEELVARCDVVHLHGLWEPLLLRIASVCRREGVPYVLAPHGMLSDWSLSEKALKKKIALAVAFRKLVTHASALHARQRPSKPGQCLAAMRPGPGHALAPRTAGVMVTLEPHTLSRSVRLLTGSAGSSGLLSWSL